MMIHVLSLPSSSFGLENQSRITTTATAKVNKVSQSNVDPRFVIKVK